MKVTEILNEVSLGDYHKKATMDRAMSQMSAAFGKPEDKEKHLHKAGRRERGLSRAKVRSDKARAEYEAKARADALEKDRANRPELEAKLKKLKAQFDPNYEYSDDHSFWSQQRDIKSAINSLERRLSQLDETATPGATSAANVGTVDAPHISPGKARGKKSYTGSPWGGKSGTKAPPQPKVKQPKKSDGTAVNGLDIKGASLFGGPPVKRS